MMNAPGTNGALNNMNERSIEPRHEWHDLANSRLHAVHWDPLAATQPPCLLVHGLGSNARLWDGVAWRLAELGHPTVAIDQRELINHLGWDQPLVAGQSWGANVVLELGYRHPTASQAIACVDGGFIELQERFPVWEDAAEMMAPPKLAGTPYTKMQQWMAKSNADWPEEGRQGQLASFEVLDDGTVTPWLTFERHLQVLRGLWEHRPSTRYASINTPLMMIPADTGDVAWTASKRAAVDAAIEALPHGRADWFSPAHHDVHAQHPAEVADLLHQAATKADFFL
jgi:pimeloyl-ACP methyl ester carboxylesterase